MSPARAVIFSTAYLPLVGGAEVALKEVTDRLPSWRFDLFCARIKPGLPDTEKIGNVVVHRVGFGHPIDKYLLPVLGPVRALMRAPTAYRLPPVIWSLMASYGGFAALVYTWLRPTSKLLLTLQEGDPLEHYAKRTGVLSFWHKMIFKRAAAVQAISRFLAQWAKDMGFRGTPDVIPNGVDIVKFGQQISPERRAELRRAFGFADADVVIVTASRLSRKNAVDDMIRSLEFLPENYRLLIVGVGEDEEMLKKLVAEKKVASRVTFLGKKTHDELPALLQASDIFCRPSLSEGLGNSFLEAMAAGIPVIGTPVGGIPDFLTDGETGVFCETQNPESIVMAVRRVSDDPELRVRLIQRAEALVRAQYGWDGIAERIGVILDALATRP